MAKASSPAQAGPQEGSELIVVVRPDAHLRSAGTTVASASGSNVSGLNSLLKNYKASFAPLFGSEARSSNLNVAAAAAFENAGINAATFYKVDTTDNLNKVAEALLNEGMVEAAFVKPPAEPPVIIDEKMAPPDMSVDAPPTTPNFVSRQIYLNPAPAGIDALYAWTLSGGKGDNVRIIDVEGAWNFTHEDLIVNQGGVIGGIPSTDTAWRYHGTAVTGEFGGDENAIGITGICPNANTRAISIFGTGQSSSKAIVDAANALSAGDIILIELHRAGPRFNFAGRADQKGYIAVEWWPDDYAAILYATSKGVIVVEAGGNGAENLSDAFYNTKGPGFPASWKNPFNTANPTSNAVLVGAGAPPPGTHGRDNGPDRSRLDFSNYGARVDCQGWGREVTTCGYGDLQGGSNENFWYTDTFSGTSSASPIIVGALGSIQGRLKNRSKPLLTPVSARNLLRTTGSPQQDAPGRPASQRIGNRPNLKQAFTTLGVGGIIIKSIKDLEKIKDIKDSVKFKDTKEFEKLKDVKEKDVFEGKPIDNIGLQPGATQNSIEGRIQNLEAVVQQLSHFISSQERPDLQATLFNDQNSQLQELQKNATDAKNAKDSKEMENI